MTRLKNGWAVPDGWFQRLPEPTRKRISRLLGPNAESMLNRALATGSDGCTMAPELFTKACWLHDGLLRLGYTWEADRQIFFAINDLGYRDGWVWRWTIWPLSASAYFAGVTVGQVYRQITGQI